MPTITITGDTTQEALEEVIYRAIGKYGKNLNLQISKNLRFENQNKEIKDLHNLKNCPSDMTFKIFDMVGKELKQKLRKLKTQVITGIDNRINNIVSLENKFPVELAKIGTNIIKLELKQIKKIVKEKL